MEKFDWIKSKTLLITAGVILGIAISYTIGHTKGEQGVLVKAAGVNLEYEKLLESVDFEKEQLKKREDMLSKVESDLEDVESSLEGKEKTLERLNTFEENEKNINKELEEKKSELVKLKSDLETKQNKLDSLTGQIQKATGSPVTLGAGYYVVGKDLKTGRYELTPAQGSGNVFIDDANGRSKLSETFGQDKEYHLQSFVMWAEEGDVMELNTPITFTPVE